MAQNSFRNFAFGTVAVAALVAAQPANAQQRSFNVPAQDARTGIPEFARQAGIQIVAPTGGMNGLRTNAVKGSLSTTDAVRQLIRGTGLEIASDKDNVVILRKANGAQGGPSGAGDEVASSADVGSGDDASQEIVVTGTNIRGIVNRTRPLTVITRDEIDKTGFATTTQLIESLPQNFALVNQSGLRVPGTAEENFATASQGSSINLRGIGEGATLTLVNGHRLATGGGGGHAVDISSLPLSAIERVDVVTDGASAIYGADAIGGVVNFILRQDYDGAETRARYGFAPGGFSEYRLSQTFGKNWRTGNALISGEYFNRDLLTTDDRDFVSATIPTGSLLPHESNYGLTFFGRQDIHRNVSFRASALYTKRNSYNLAGNVPTAGLNFRNVTDDKAFLIAGGLRWNIANNWQLELAASHARNRSNTERIRANNGTTDRFFNRADAALKTVDLKADGRLMHLPGGAVRAAAGLNWRREEFTFTGSSDAPQDLAQNVSSAYVETYIPLFGYNNSVGGVRRLELSGALRYDKYSNFGSALSPLLGAMWEPIDGLRLRGMYSTSYKAPDLRDYSTAFNIAIMADRAFSVPPMPGVINMQLNGSNADGYKPQTAKIYSAGFELQPGNTDLTLSGNFYSISYNNIISSPNFVYTDPAYENLLIRNPSQSQIDQFVAYSLLGAGLGYCDPTFCDFVDPETFDTSIVDELIDNRRSNLSSLKTSGFDLSAGYKFDLGGGSITLNSTMTFVFDRKFKFLRSSTPTDSAGTIYNIPKFRMRSFAGWSSQNVNLNLFWNHIGPTTDNRFSPGVEVDSFDTLDMSAAYAFDGRTSRSLSGLRLGLSVTNVFDRDPVRTRIANPVSDLGFDPTKGSVLGRLIAFEVTKSW